MAEKAQILPPDTQLFRDIFTASPIGIAVENLEGQPLFVNPALCAMLGFTEEEMCIKHCVQFSPPEDADKDWALFQQLRSGLIDHYQLEKRYFRRDGSLVWGQLSVSLLTGGPSPLVVAMVEDITGKKKAEEAQSRHSAIVESSDDAIMSVTLDHTISTWNAGAERIYGYTEAEALGQPIDMIVPPELPNEENKIFETLRAGGRIEQFETVRITKTGKRIDVSLSISPIKDAAGEVVGCSGIARDITERKRTEEALRTSEERLRLAQQAARIGTFEWNIQTGVNTWTPELEEIYGLPPGGFGGTQTAFENLVHPDDRAGVIELTNWALKTGKPAKGEWRALWPDGSIHWIAGRWQVFSESVGPSRMIGVNADVTERKVAEEALRESEQRFRLAAEAGKMYSFEWDVTTNQVVRSAERFKILGVAEPLRTTHQEFVQRMHPEDRPTFIATIAGLTPENPAGIVTFRAVASDGVVVWLRSTGRAFFDGEGKMLRVIGMVADISDLKRAEEALAGMTRKLIESQEQERARIGRELHDDINQRLAMFAVELEQLQENPSDVETRIGVFRQQITKISNDVQALAHDLHSSQLEYLGVVPGMKSWCKEFSERRKMDIDFRSDVANVLPFEIGVCLFRVLQEALHNIVKHSGVKHVDVRLTEHSNQIHLRVSDSGKGFDVESTMQGKGLGLTSMRERVRLVNGTIAIESNPMGGTTIEVHVPFESEHDSQRAS